MKNTTPSLKKVQFCRVKRLKNKSHSDSFFNLLTSDLLFEEIERQLPDHRERHYPPTETLAMFLSQAMSDDRSCQNVVNRRAVQRLAQGMPVGSVGTGGYCRARQRLPLSLVQSLTRFLGRQMDHVTPSNWLWQSRRVRIVDGTTVTMPDTKENQSVYPQQRAQAPGLGFPICRIVGITSLENGALIDAAVSRFRGKGSDERSLLRGMWNTFCSGDIVLGDALFATYFLLQKCKRKESTC